MMLKDVIKGASSVTPHTITVSLKDMLFVHGVLYRVAQHYQEQGRYPELKQSRLYFCFDVINFPMPDINEYPVEERGYSLNMTLPRQLLVETTEVIKCVKCKAIVTAELSSPHAVRKAYEFPDWQCKACGLNFNDCELRCERCRRCRDTATITKALLIKRYRPVNQQPVLAFLQEILVSIPLIPQEEESFDDVIDVTRLWELR